MGGGGGGGGSERQEKNPFETANVLCCVCVISGRERKKRPMCNLQLHLPAEKFATFSK